MKLVPWRNKREERAAASFEEHPLAVLRRHIDELFGRFFRDPWGAGLAEGPGALGWGPRMDMSQSEKEVTFRFELPGVRPEELDLNVAANVLTLRGQKRESREEKAGACTYSERSFGSFSRSVQLPATVDPERVEASYKDGVLTIRLAKLPGAQPRRITVRSG